MPRDPVAGLVDRLLARAERAGAERKRHPRGSELESYAHGRAVGLACAAAELQALLDALKGNT